jgi:hypothetical protein
MSLQFNPSNTNFISTLQDEADVNQYVFQASNTVQKLNLTNVNKIVVHCWGGGGGGGSSQSGPGAGGGGSFTILDFPYYPVVQEINVEAEVGFGGTGGYYNTVTTNYTDVSSTYVPASNGQMTKLTLKNGSGRILKEFVSYGGIGGGGNVGYLNIANGGGGGNNSTILNSTSALMDAYWIRGNVNSLPAGGNAISSFGEHCQINYMNVTGSGGGASKNLGSSNDGGSFLLQEGGKGSNSNIEIVYGGGGGSTYYGRGGDGYINENLSYTPNKFFKYTFTHSLPASPKATDNLSIVKTSLYANNFDIFVMTAKPRLYIPSLSNKIYTIYKNTDTFDRNLYSILDGSNNVTLVNNTSYVLYLELMVYVPSIKYFRGQNGETNSGAGGGGAPFGEFIGTFIVTYLTDTKFKISTTPGVHKQFAIASYYATHAYFPALSADMLTITPAINNSDRTAYIFTIGSGMTSTPVHNTAYLVSLYSRTGNFRNQGGRGGNGLAILEVYH